MSPERAEQKYFAAGAEFDAELNRLRVLESVSDPTTVRHLDRLGIATGHRCLEAGAGAGSIAAWMRERVGPRGHVVAVDLDTRFVETVAGVEVRALDIAKEPLDEAAFDMVHARNLLVHIPEAGAALMSLIRALTPGGVLLIEEPDTTVIAAMDKTHPLAASFDNLMGKKIEFLRSTGVMDMSFTMTIPALLRDAGLEDCGNEGTTQIARGGSVIAGVVLSAFERLDPMLVAHGVTTATEVDDAHSALRDPTFAFRNMITLAAWGRAPVA